jgi:hypothetical protein
MIIRILGDSHRNYDGKLEAQFIDEQTNSLYFDLKDWEDIEKNGIVSGNEIKLINPLHLEATFDTDYQVEKDAGEIFYQALKENGWNTTRQLL